MTSSERTIERPWSVAVRVDDVPETGKHLSLQADAAMRLALATPVQVDAVERVEAIFNLSRRGRDGLHVTGRVTATVRQTCVVTLEPVVNQIDEAVDVDFAPSRAPRKPSAEIDIEVSAPEIEPLTGNSVDLGLLATEFLILGVDPYPRKPDAAFEVPNPGAALEAHPFAGLAALKKGKD
jgi:hypothetical protein